MASFEEDSELEGVTTDEEEISPTDPGFISLVQNAHRPNIHNILQYHAERPSDRDTPFFSSSAVDHNMTPIVTGFTYPSLPAPSMKFSRHLMDSTTSMSSGQRSRTGSGVSANRQSHSSLVSTAGSKKNSKRDNVMPCMRSVVTANSQSVQSTNSQYASPVGKKKRKADRKKSCQIQKQIKSDNSIESDSKGKFVEKPSTLSGVLEHLESHPQLRYRESDGSLLIRPLMEDKEVQVDIRDGRESPTSSRPSTSQSAKAMTWSYFTGKQPEKHNLHFLAEEEAEEKFDNFFEDLVTKREKGRKTNKNVRAGLNKWKLFIHDFRTWYRRRKLKQNDIPVLRKEIQKIEGYFGSGLVSFFVFCRWILLLDLVLALVWCSFVIVPTAVSFNYNFTQPFYFTSLFDGQNALEESWLFYCSYDPALLPSYDLSLAYLAVILFTYFGSFIFVLRSLANALGQEGNSKNDIRYSFCHLFFSSWDFSLTSGKAVENLQNGIINLVKDSVHEDRARQRIQHLSSGEKCNIYMRRTLAWMITGLLIGGGSGAIVYLVMFVDIADLLGEAPDSNHVLVVYGLTLSFLSITTTVRTIVAQLPKLERYMKGKVELDVTLSRIFLLQLANLFALIISLYRKVTTDGSGGCAGTTIGQEIYKLVIIDTLTSILITMIPPFFMRYRYKKKQDFEIPMAVLNIVYRQALIWFGMITCPMLPLIGALSTTIDFMTNYIVVMKCCKPPTKRWNQPRHSSAFYSLLIATLVPVLIPVSVMIGSEDLITLGTNDRGPFKEKKPLAALTSTLSIMPAWCIEAIQWLSSPVVLLPAILIMIAIINFQRLRIDKEKRHRVVFHQQLQVEREENKKLARKLRV